MIAKMVAALSLSIIGGMVAGVGIVFGDLAILGVGLLCAAVGSLMRITEAEKWARIDPTRPLSLAGADSMTVNEYTVWAECTRTALAEIDRLRTQADGFHADAYTVAASQLASVLRAHAPRIDDTPPALTPYSPELGA